MKPTKLLDIYEAAVQTISNLQFTLDDEALSTLKEDFKPTSEVTKGLKTVLYPLGGEDVLYPFTLFPDVEELYIVDSRSFKNVYKAGSIEPEIYNAGLINRALRRKLNSKVQVPISVRYAGKDIGYDITNPLFHIFQKTDTDSHTGEIGTANLILARLKAMGAEINSIKAENDKVHTISVSYEGKQRQVHFIQADLGIAYKELETDDGFQWLADNVRGGKVDAILGKGIPNPAKAGGNIATYALRDSNIEKIVTKFSDQRTIIALDFYAAKTTLGVENFLTEHQSSSGFGYDDKFYIGPATDALLTEIGNGESRRNTLQTMEAKQKADEAQRNKQRHIKLLNDRKEFFRKSPKKKYEYLEKIGAISKSGNELCFNFEELYCGSPDSKIFQSFGYEELWTAFSEVLKHARSLSVTGLKIELPPYFINPQHGICPAIITEAMGDSMTSLKITATYNLTYLSEFSSRTAEVLKVHGKNLSHIEVQANSNGAIKFAEAIYYLSKNGKLTDPPLIAPIQGEWKPEAETQIRDTLALAIKEIAERKKTETPQPRSSVIPNNKTKPLRSLKSLFSGCFPSR
jgi:hypothetical protein